MKRIFQILSFHLLLISVANAQQWGDYTFYSVQNQSTAVLIDNSKSVYHSWSFTSGKTGYSSYLLKGGTVLRSIARSGNILSGAAMCGEVQKVDWNNNIVWDFVYSSSTYCTHHDICPMPNGNVLLISYDVKTAADAVTAGCSKSTIIWAEKIVEVQPTGATTGTVVWEWHVWDHLCQTYSSAKSNYVTSIVEHPELLNINYSTQQDWMHANGIDYNATLDQIVFSSHNLNELYVIDHSTTTAEAATHTGGKSGKGGDFLYRWGNPAAYGATGTKIFNIVHDAHWVAQDCPKAGYIGAFNNNGISTSKSCVDLIAPPYNGYNYSITSGSAFTPATYTWRHSCNGHSTDMSNSQQLPNGNSLVCIAQSGYIYEIDSLGNSLWNTTISGIVPKAFRYSAAYVSGAVASANAPVVTTNQLFSVPENVLKGAAVGTLLATDADAGTTLQSWTITGGSGASIFSLNSATGLLTVSNATLDFETTSSYTLTVQVSDGVLTSANETLTIQITNVNEAPVARITVDPTVESVPLTNLSFSGASSSDVDVADVLTYNWDFGDGGSGSGVTSSHAYNQSGSFTAKLTVTDAGGLTNSATASVTVSSTTSIPGTDLNGLKIYPNPSTCNFSVELSQLNEKTLLQIIDSKGKVVAQQELIEKITNINQKFEKGIYFLKIYNENGVVIEKLVVQ